MNLLPLVTAVVMILAAGVQIVVFIATNRSMTEFLTSRMNKLENKVDDSIERIGSLERKVDVLAALRTQGQRRLGE